ncbi:unnamed protein product [Closterium sp. NIES-65]|nr:unnamed protein product [Closterium sp. NIES-65]
MRAFETPGGLPPQQLFGVKCAVAPIRCAEAMILEWMAEPRVGVLMDLGRIRSLYPAIMAQLGAGRQVENDCVASMLVQVLGVKESADLQEGFGALMQNLLSGGLEKAHAAEKGSEGAGGMGAEKTHEEEGGIRGETAEKAQGEEGWADGEVMDRGGGMEKEEEQGVDDAEHGGGEGSEFRCSHCSEGGSSNSGDVQVNGIPKGMYVSGVSATDIALAFAEELSKAERCVDACMLGAIPKPLTAESLPIEWEEWPHGDEAASKLPDDPDARFYLLGFVEESATGVESEQKRVTEEASKAGRRHKRGKVRGAKAPCQASDGSGSVANRGHGEEQRASSHACGMAVARPPFRRKLPIVCCVADADFFVEGVGRLMSPPACAQCIHCYRSFYIRIPSIALIAKFAYCPLYVLFNRFLSVFPPHSAGFDALLENMGLPPFPSGSPSRTNLAVLCGELEKERVFFLLLVAHMWPTSILDMEQFEGIEVF